MQSKFRKLPGLKKSIAATAVLALSVFLLYPEARAAARPGSDRPAAGLTRLTNLTNFIRGSEIRSAVKAFIEKNMPWDKDSVHILFPASTPDAACPGDKINYEVRAGRSEQYIGDTVFKVLFFSGDTLAREEPVRVRIEVMLDVPVTARSLARDAEIGKDDIKIVGRWFTRLPSGTITDPREVIGKSASVSIRPNSEISRSMVKNSILVNRGRVVRIVLEDGPLRILSTGLAEESGGRNDVIRVRNTSSNKMVYARIIEPSVVKVEFQP